MADQPSREAEQPTFEQALARLVGDGTITRDEALANADSPTNLMWRMDNDLARVAQAAAQATEATHPDDDDMPSFTEITLDVKPL